MIYLKNITSLILLFSEKESPFKRKKWSSFVTVTSFKEKHKNKILNALTGSLSHKWKMTPSLIVPYGKVTIN